MNYDPKKHHRRPIRLKGYDYFRAVWYFITICTQNREMLFGKVVNGKMVLNGSWQFANQCWREIPDHYPNVQLDEYVIMHNHVHGIIGIINNENVGANDNLPHDTHMPMHTGAENFSPQQSSTQFRSRSPSRTIGSTIRGFKKGVTKCFCQDSHIHSIWQRNYYEHILCGKNDFNRIRRYIIENLLKLQDDMYFQQQDLTL